MAWLRVSDSAGNNPIVLAPLLTDPAELPPMDAYAWCNSLMGLVMRCATSAAGYGRNYYVSDATIASYAGPQWRAAAEAAQRAGYWTPTERGWLLVDDPDHMLHIRTGEEIDWERARRVDAANPKLVIPVRQRDGDGCRYCGLIVRWGDNRSARGATYDHRIPGRQAETPEDLRVACRSCNTHRGNDPNADEHPPPRPVPAAPFYGPETARFLRERGFEVPISTRAPERPGGQPDTAPRDPASGGIPRSDPASGGTTLPSDRAAGATTQLSAAPPVDAVFANSANQPTAKARSPGRVGTGSDRKGSGRDGARHDPQTRRARRGKHHRR